MSETSKALTRQTPATLCRELLNVYGEPSHHARTVQQASFEVNDHDGREYKLLLLQKKVGVEAVYSLRLRETLDGKHESIYTLDEVSDTVDHKLKIADSGVYGPYQWPAATIKDWLADCHGNQRF